MPRTICMYFGYPIPLNCLLISPLAHAHPVRQLTGSCRCCFLLFPCPLRTAWQCTSPPVLPFYLLPLALPRDWTAANTRSRLEKAFYVCCTRSSVEVKVESN
ncbi:hypothetical protein BDU57DRAFT_512053, partial [Ampelomyces quisqualis]